MSAPVSRTEDGEVLEKLDGGPQALGGDRGQIATTDNPITDFHATVRRITEDMRGIFNRSDDSVGVYARIVIPELLKSCASLCDVAMTLEQERDAWTRKAIAWEGETRRTLQALTTEGADVVYRVTTLSLKMRDGQPAPKPLADAGIGYGASKVATDAEGGLSENTHHA